MLLQHLSCTSRGRREPLGKREKRPASTRAEKDRTRASRPANSLLQREVRKRKPFDTPAQEAYLSIQRTASLLAADFQRVLKPHGLSEATYNVLRILRGALAEDVARTCSEIGEHMVTPVPDVTRLVDRLESRGLVLRTRDIEDRRIVRVSITDEGLAILAQLDGPVSRSHRSQLGHVSDAELARLISLLAKVRQPRRR